MSTATYTDSYNAAKGHGKAFLQSTIGAHPGTTAVIMGLLVVLVLVLGYKLYEKDKSGFISPVNNLTTGNNNPLWQLGAMDAGNWGPVHRDPTAWNVAAYHPGWRPGGGGTCYGKEGSAVGCNREGLAPGGPVAPNGGTIYLRPGPPSLCGRGWDPAASAEAEALATVGALQHESYGEGRLQGAIDAAYDSSHGLSDDQLAALMHQGGAP